LTEGTPFTEMSFLIDPNVCYFFLVCGLVVGILALLTPGSGILELSALFLLFLAGYGIYNLPVNYWALGIVLLGAVTFVVAFWLKKMRHWATLLFSTACLIIGSAFLFKNTGGEAVIHPAFIIFATIVAEAFIYFVGSKTLAASTAKPIHNLDTLINMTGTAESNILTEGIVYVNGEEWTARSETAIPAGSDVKIVDREGLVLTVVPVSPESSNSPTMKDSSVK